MANVNTTLESVTPSNPQPGETVEVEVKIVATEVGLSGCIHMTYQVDIIINGETLTTHAGRTMCEGDPADFVTVTTTLPAGSHDVVVDGFVRTFSGEESVSDVAGTINVEAPFSINNISFRTGSCNATPTSPAPGESVTVEVFVKNENDAPANITVAWDDQKGNELAQKTLEVPGTGGRRFEASFMAPASGSVTPVPRVANATSLATASQRVGIQLPGTQ